MLFRCLFRGRYPETYLHATICSLYGGKRSGSFEALGYKSEGRGFDSVLGHWIFN
jgi:hypothetical protein